MMKTEVTEPYGVDVEREGCPHCGAGRQWEVYIMEGDDAVGVGGQAFEDREDAEHLAAELNEAYRLGRAAQGGG